MGQSAVLFSFLSSAVAARHSARTHQVMVENLIGILSCCGPRRWSSAPSGLALCYFALTACKSVRLPPGLIGEGLCRPSGTCVVLPLYPALKRWAKLFRPSAPVLHSQHVCLVLTARRFHGSGGLRRNAPDPGATHRSKLFCR